MSAPADWTPAAMHAAAQTPQKRLQARLWVWAGCLLVGVLCALLWAYYGRGAGVVLASVPIGTATPRPPSSTPRPTHTARALPSATPLPPTPTRRVPGWITATPTPNPTATDDGRPDATALPMSNSAPVTRVSDGGPYVIQNERVTYLPNFGNELGCRWMGLVGQVFGAAPDLVPAVGFLVHVEGIGRPIETLSGTAPMYGVGGFAIDLADAPRDTHGQYQAQLLDVGGAPLSPRYSFPTYADCARNAVLAVFVWRQP